MRKFAVFGIALAVVVIAARTCSHIVTSDCTGDVYVACRGEPSVTMDECARIARGYCEAQ